MIVLQVSMNLNFLIVFSVLPSAAIGAIGINTFKESSEQP